MSEFDPVAHALKRGMEYPYDDTYKGDVDWAHKAARAILYDFSDRKGIKHALSDVDEEIRIEIVEAMASYIRRAAETPI